MKAFIWVRSLEDRPKCRHGSAVVVAETIKEAIEIVRKHEAEHPEYSYHVADLMEKTPPTVELEVIEEKSWIPCVSFADLEDD